MFQGVKVGISLEIGGRKSSIFKITDIPLKYKKLCQSAELLVCVNLEIVIEK